MIRFEHLHLILVNDNVKQRDRLTKLARDLGIGGVSIVEDMPSLEAAIPSDSPSALVIGDTTPLGDALETLAAIKENPITKVLPRILHTDGSKPEKTRALVAKGINGVLDDPIDIKKLKVLLRNYLREKNTKTITQLVRAAEFFKEFNNDELKVLAKVAICRHFEAGETIITKDDPSDRFYVLLKGKVEVLITKEGSPHIQLEVQPGHCFGEMGILEGSPRSAFCIAADDCYALEIGTHILNDTQYLLRLKILTQMAFILAKRIRTMNVMLEQRPVTQEREGAAKVPTKLTPQALKMRKEELPEPAPAPELPARPEGVERESPQKKEEAPPAPPKVEVKAEEAPPPKAEKSKPPAPSKKSAGDPVDEEEVDEEYEEEDTEPNPFAVPTATTDEIDDSVRSQEEYDVLQRKINLRNDFIANKIPNAVVDVIANKMYSYWTGGKLAKINPHRLWSVKWFTEGTPTLKRALHLVVIADKGDEAFEQCFLGLPFTHRLVGLTQIGCVGTFLGCSDAIDRFFERQCLRKAIQLDLEMPIDRLWYGNECIEFLTHTTLDVRNDTMFLVFDDVDGANTARVRNRFPEHQIVTVVRGIGWNPEVPATLFTHPEELLAKQGHLVPKEEYKGHGFYSGETFFIPDLSNYYEDTDVMKDFGYLFGTVGTFAKIGPDYSGQIWGSKGGAEGAVKAARAMYGITGAQSPEDLASAINWADG